MWEIWKTKFLSSTSSPRVLQATYQVPTSICNLLSHEFGVAVLLVVWHRYVKKARKWQQQYRLKRRVFTYIHCQVHAGGLGDNRKTLSRRVKFRGRNWKQCRQPLLFRFLQWYLKTVPSNWLSNVRKYSSTMDVKAPVLHDFELLLSFRPLTRFLGK